MKRFLVLALALVFLTGARLQHDGASGTAGSSNSFETINAPAGTDPVADSSTGTLNLTSTGGTVTITGDAATDTINLEAAAVSGDITAVGDCATGAAFGGACGTALTFGVTDPADAGAIRLENATSIAWEASPAGVDVTLTVDASEVLTASGVFTATGGVTIDANTEANIEAGVDLAGEVTAVDLDTTVIADSVAVNSWNLTTPTITTSLTTSTPTTLSVAELDRLDGLAGVVVTDTTAATEIDGTNLTITAGTLNVDDASEFAGLLTADANLDVKNGASAAVLSLYEASGSGTNFASLQVPALAANTVYTLPADDGTVGQVLQTNGTGTLSWQPDADSGGATAFSAIGDAAGDGAVAMAETVQTLDWNTAAVASLAITGLSLTYTNDAAADILSQTLFRVANLAGANGIEVLQEIGNDDTDDVATTGLLFTSAAGAITTAIDASDAEIGVALAIGANSLTAADGGLVNLSAANNSTTTEGLLLPQSTTAGSGTAEGQIHWNTALNMLGIGDGAASKIIGGQVAVQVLTAATGTYTPNANLVGALVIAVGGGGAGALCDEADEVSGGGGGGGTAIEYYSAATIGASQYYEVAEAAASASAGDTTLFGTAGALLSVTGGGVGIASGNNTSLGAGAAGADGGVGSGGNLNIAGADGTRGIIFDTSAKLGGTGGSSVFGGGGKGQRNGVGTSGGAYGGGGGGCSTSDDTNRDSGAGAAGVIYVIEFLG